MGLVYKVLQLCIQIYRQSLKIEMLPVKSTLATDNEGLSNGRGKSLALQCPSETVLNSKCFYQDQITGKKTGNTHLRGNFLELQKH